MTKCGDLFRYVPQIEQTGLPVHPKVMKLLLERDRQLEDYLSTLDCAGSSAPSTMDAIRVSFANQNVGSLGEFIAFSTVLAQLGTGLTWDVGDPTRIYVSASGAYLVDYGVGLTPHVGGSDGAWIETNDGRFGFAESVYGLVPQTQSQPPVLLGHDVVFIGAGEPMRLFVTQGSGATLTASPLAYHRGMTVARIA